MLKRVLSFSLFFLYGILNLYSQNKYKADNNDVLNKYTSNVNELVDIYKQQSYSLLEYVYGREYKIIYPQGRPNPFLNSGISKGTVFVNGIAYSGLYIIYDIFKDALIVKSEKVGTESKYIQLEKSKIDSFYISVKELELTFITKKVQNNASDILFSGFCEEIYNNKIELYLKHKVSISSAEGYDSFKLMYDLVLCKNGSYFKISSKQKLLKLFEEHKKEIRKEIAGLNIRYKNMSRAQLKDLMLFIENLTFKSAV